MATSTGFKKNVAREKLGAKKTTAKKTTTQKTGAKSAVKKSGANKAGAKKSTLTRRKYSRGASAAVGEEMRELESGTARSGRSGKKVTNRKQAIAIGLSKARRSGEKVPPSPGRRKKS